jgi:hypothetical protein
MKLELKLEMALEKIELLETKIASLQTHHVPSENVIFINIDPPSKISISNAKL